MPLLPAQSDPVDAPEATFRRTADDPSNQPGWLDVARVAGQQSFGDLYNKIKTDSFVMAGGDDPNYNPVEHIPAGGPTAGTSYADYHDFLDARNGEQMAQIKRKVDADAQGQEVIVRAGGAKAFAANVAIGSSDPLNLAMMTLVPELAPTRLGNALRFGLVNAATTAGEAALSNTGEDFLTKGNVFNVAGSAVLGGILGTAIRPRVSAARFNAVSNAVHSVLHEGAPAADVLGEMRPSVASRGTLEPELGELPPATSRPGEPTISEGEAPQTGGTGLAQLGGAAKAISDNYYDMILRTLKGEVNTGKIDPFYRQAKPAFDAGQIKTVDDLKALTHPIAPAVVNPNEGSTSGAMAVAHPVTGEDMNIALGGRLFSRTIGKIYPDMRILNSESDEAKKLLLSMADVKLNLEGDYRGIGREQPIERDLYKYDAMHLEGIRDRKAFYSQYASRVSSEGGKALSLGEFEEAMAHAARNGDRSPIPEVQAAQKAMRERVYDPTLKAAQEVGSLPEEVKLLGAESYFPRMADRRKIAADRAGWIDLLRRHFAAQGADSNEATDFAYKVTNRMMGSTTGRMDWKAMEGLVPKAGPFKERTLNIPDNELEPYLDNDYTHVTHSYLRSIAPEIEFARRELDQKGFESRLGDIGDEYARRMEQARAAGDKERGDALSKEQRKVLDDLNMVRERLFGVYGEPKDPGYWSTMAGRLMSGMRNLNAARLLGFATFKHMPDVANMIMRFGTPRTFAALARLGTSIQGTKLAVRAAQRIGAAGDMIMNSTGSLLGDYSSHSQFAEQRLLSKLARTATIASGETPLITFFQAVTSALGHDELLRVADRLASGGKVSANRLAGMASAGIDEDMLRRISAENAKTPAAKIRGMRFADTEQWTDRAAARAFDSAVVREAHGVTLRPGVADTPGIMSEEVYKTLFQFKSFGFAASKIVTARALQGIAHGDMRAVQGVLAALTAGAMVAMMRRKMSGEPISSKPAGLALDTLENSNVTGWIGDLIYPSLWQSGFQGDSNPMRQSAASLAGPTAELGEQAIEHRFPARIANLLTGGRVNEKLPFRRSDLHFMRQMVPGQSLWYFRNTLDKLEDGVGDVFDLPGKSQAQLREEREKQQ